MTEGADVSGRKSPMGEGPNQHIQMLIKCSSKWVYKHGHGWRRDNAYGKASGLPLPLSLHPVCL